MAAGGVLVNPYVFGAGGGGNGPDGTNYYVEVTISSTNVDSNLTDFPLFVDLRDMPAAFWTNIESDGRSIRATDSSGSTQYPRDLVEIDTTGEDGELYVKVPTVSSTASTVVRIYYGNASATQPAASDTYGSDNTWKTAYKGVWHLAESSGTRLDFTSNSNDLSDVNTVTTGTGYWAGTAGDFERTNSERLNIDDTSQTGLDITGDITFTAIVRLESSPSNHFVFAKWQGNGTNRSYRLYAPNTNKFQFDYMNSSNLETNIDIDETVSSATWYVLTVQVDVSAQSATAWLNGASATTSTGSTSASSIRDGGGQFEIGSYNHGDLHWDGLIEEIRVADGLLGTAWVKAENINLHDATNLYSVGTQQDA